MDIINYLMFFRDVYNVFTTKNSVIAYNATMRHNVQSNEVKNCSMECKICIKYRQNRI